MGMLYHRSPYQRVLQPGNIQFHTILHQDMQSFPAIDCDPRLQNLIDFQYAHEARQESAKQFRDTFDDPDLQAYLRKFLDGSPGGRFSRIECAIVLFYAALLAESTGKWAIAQIFYQISKKELPASEVFGHLELFVKISRAMLMQNLWDDADEWFRDLLQLARSLQRERGDEFAASLKPGNADSVISNAYLQLSSIALSRLDEQTLFEDSFHAFLEAYHYLTKAHRRLLAAVKRLDAGDEEGAEDAFLTMFSPEMENFASVAESLELLEEDALDFPRTEDEENEQQVLLRIIGNYNWQCADILIWACLLEQDHPAKGLGLALASMESSITDLIADADELRKDSSSLDVILLRLNIAQARCNVLVEGYLALYRTREAEMRLSDWLNDAQHALDLFQMIQDRAPSENAMLLSAKDLCEQRLRFYRMGYDATGLDEAKGILDLISMSHELPGIIEELGKKDLSYAHLIGRWYTLLGQVYQKLHMQGKADNAFRDARWIFRRDLQSSHTLRLRELDLIERGEII